MEYSRQLFFLVIFFFILQFQSRSQAYITLQHGSDASVHTILDSAIVHAQNGDYIYIPGGSFTLNTPINKRLYIYGTGHYPDSTRVTNESKINGDVIFITGADSGLISGIYITGSTKFGTSSTNQVVNGYTIMRCYLGLGILLAWNYGNTTSSGFYIAENIIANNVNSGNAQNVMFEKNIFQWSVGNDNGTIYRNNIFLLNPVNSSQTPLGNTNPASIKNCLFENNIILDATNPINYNGIYTLNCTFNNNIFIYNQGFPDATNVGSNNVVGQAQGSIFVNMPSNSFNYTYDYHLQESSPGNNAGTDGFDIGIYGTGEPYKDGAVPVTPHIRQKSISSSNNTINVNIKVAAQDR
jgi:hypothetical protein